MGSFYPFGFSAQAQAQAEASTSGRATEIQELLRKMPECRALPDGTTIVLPVTVPRVSSSGAPATVQLTIEVPTDYPKSPPVFAVAGGVQLAIIDAATGHLDPSPHRSGLRLAESAANAFELLTGRAYAGATPSHTAAYPGGAAAALASHPVVGTEPAQLQSKIIAALKAMPSEELYELITDKSAFEKELRKWLQETVMGGRYLKAKSRVTELAAENSQLHDELQNADQQARAACDTELRDAQADYDRLRERQAAVLRTIDVSGLVATMRRDVAALDKGEQERDLLGEAGVGGEPRERAEVKALVDTLRRKREAFHAADIRATAAETLQP